MAACSWSERFERLQVYEVVLVELQEEFSNIGLNDFAGDTELAGQFLDGLHLAAALFQKL